MRILGINALFHDPAAALVVDGQVVAAIEEERLSRRKHGKRPVPFSAWELPELAAAACLQRAGLEPGQLDRVAYSYDPRLAEPAETLGLQDPWDPLRQRFARTAPGFLATALPGLDPADVDFVPHHVAHAASAGLAGPGARQRCSVLVLDGRGEATSHLAGRYRRGELEVMARQRLPHSLGLAYESLTEHLGFLRSSDEYKVMALASYGEPRFLPEVRAAIRSTGDGGFRTDPIDWNRFAKRVHAGDELAQSHADLAASVQRAVEDTVLSLARWVHAHTKDRLLVLAGGVALNCVANTRIHDESPFDEVWVQPAAGDAGTALGAALHVATVGGDECAPMPDAALGRDWTDAELEAELVRTRTAYERPDDLAETVAAALSANQIIAWFQGRSEYGPRALGQRSLLAHPGYAQNLERLNEIKGREQFRPVAPMVLAERAGDIFGRGPLPSPYMLFVHDVEPAWRDRIPAVVHVDGTARVQTVERSRQPLLAATLGAFERRTGLPVLVNTSLNTAGRPMVDSPRDALECFGSAPVDVLVLGPFVVRRCTGHQVGLPGVPGTAA